MRRDILALSVAVLSVVLLGCSRGGVAKAESLKVAYEKVQVGMSMEELNGTIGGAGMPMEQAWDGRAVFQAPNPQGGASRAIFQMKDGKVESKEWEDTGQLTKEEIDAGGRRMP